MSSTGIYPQLDLTIFENTFSDSELNNSIFYVERFMRKHFSQVNILRLGGLMGGSRVFSNYVKTTTDTSYAVNHIHYMDVCSVIASMIDKNMISKVYNLVAPQHPTKQEIINYQKQENKSIEKRAKNRVVSSNTLMTELNYTFKYPNPVVF